MIVIRVSLRTQLKITFLKGAQNVKHKKYMSKNGVKKSQYSIMTPNRVDKSGTRINMNQIFMHRSKF